MMLMMHITFSLQHYLYELIINVLVHNNCFYQLHQFLQYHVLSDSKPLVRFFSFITIFILKSYADRPEQIV